MRSISLGQEGVSQHVAPLGWKGLSKNTLTFICDVFESDSEIFCDCVCCIVTISLSLNLASFLQVLRDLPVNIDTLKQVC